MELNYFILLFIIIPFIIIVSFLYYCVNYLLVDNNENEITNPNDLPELQDEEKYPEENVVELQIIEDEEDEL